MPMPTASIPVLSRPYVSESATSPRDIPEAMPRPTPFRILHRTINARLDSQKWKAKKPMVISPVPMVNTRLFPSFFIRKGVRIMTASWETDMEFASRPNLE